MLQGAFACYPMFAAGLVCFAAFSWGATSHFRQTGRVPFGTYVISVLTVTGFLWFAWRMVSSPPSMLWPAAFMLFLISIALFAWTIMSTRKTPPTMAFDTDEPSFLLHQGPYRYVRHPFYLSYLLFWTGTAIASQHLLPWLAPLVMLLVYWNAAAREERKFANSNLSAAYQNYRAKTGRFLPRLRTDRQPTETSASGR